MDALGRCPSGVAHADCQHRLQVGFALPQPAQRLTATISLCECPCHRRCPVTRRDVVGFDEWYRHCTCSGAVFVRRVLQRLDEERRARGPHPAPLPAPVALQRHAGPVDFLLRYPRMAYGAARFAYRIVVRRA